MERRGASLEEIEVVYRARYPVFLRVALGIVGDEERAADAIHDAFVRAVRQRRRYRGEAPLEAWLWRIVVNEARRTSAVREQRHTIERVVRSNGDESDVRLRAMVAALPERQRLTLFLRYYADLDYAAIAETLNVAPGTVAATLHAAHRALRKQLSEVTE